MQIKRNKKKKALFGNQRVELLMNSVALTNSCASNPFFVGCNGKNPPMTRKLFTLFLTSLTALSCSDNCRDEWHSTHLIHNFFLEWELQPKTQHITIGSWSCGVGGNEIITDQAIYAVGYDSSFIIAKLHPNNPDSTGSLNLDKSKTTYYIINIKDYPDKWQTNKNVTTYDDRDSFIRARQQLGISNKLDFDIIAKNLE